MGLPTIASATRSMLPARSRTRAGSSGRGLRAGGCSRASASSSPRSPNGHAPYRRDARGTDTVSTARTLGPDADAPQGEQNAGVLEGRHHRCRAERPDPAGWQPMRVASKVTCPLTPTGSVRGRASTLSPPGNTRRSCGPSRLGISARWRSSTARSRPARARGRSEAADERRRALGFPSSLRATAAK